MTYAMKQILTLPPFCKTNSTFYHSYTLRQSTPQSGRPQSANPRTDLQKSRICMKQTISMNCREHFWIHCLHLVTNCNILQNTILHSSVIGDCKTFIFNIETTIYDIIFIFGICKVCATVNLKKLIDHEITLTL